MNIFGRTFDIILAFICMFALPFLYFKAELKDLSFDLAIKEADLFIERVQRSECLDESFADDLWTGRGALTGIRFGIEIERRECVTGTEKTIVAKISDTEITRLLEKYKRLPLKRNDTVKVTVTGNVFGIKTGIVRKGCVR